MHASPPARPTWPWSDEHDRITNLTARRALLDEDWEEVLSRFLSTVWGSERRSAVGIVDTSSNLCQQLASQLSTPGLYEQPPRILAPANSGPLLELLEHGLWFEPMRDTEYFTRGMGDAFVVPTVDLVDGEPRLTQRLVYATDVHVDVHPARPREAVTLYELRLFGATWGFEVYDLTDPNEPAMYALFKSAEGWTRQSHLAFVDVPPEGLVGDAYPHRFQSGRPYIPHVHYGLGGAGFWSWNRGRQIHRSTLHAARLTNTALYGTDAAAFKHVAAIDLEPPKGVTLRNAGQDGALGSMEILPGTMVFHRTEGDVQGRIQEIGPSVDPLQLFAAAKGYAMQVLAAHGLRDADITRNEGNPTSAAALVISDSTRRELQRALAPSFQRSDREQLARIAAQLARVTGAPIPEGRFTIEYHMLPEAPTERAAVREDLAYQRDQGLISPVDEWLAFHPGTNDRDEAMTAIVAARIESAEIERLVSLATASMAAPPPMPPNPTDDQE